MYPHPPRLIAFTKSLRSPTRAKSIIFWYIKNEIRYDKFQAKSLDIDTYDIQRTFENVEQAYEFLINSSWDKDIILVGDYPTNLNLMTTAGIPQ